MAFCPNFASEFNMVLFSGWYVSSSSLNASVSQNMYFVDFWRNYGQVYTFLNICLFFMRFVQGGTTNLFVESLKDMDNELSNVTALQEAAMNQTGKFSSLINFLNVFL